MANTMNSAHDVAAYILEELGPVTPMKLQKLLYYCQAWHLVCNDEPLFGEDIEAWDYGPVVRPIYQAHRGERGHLVEWPQGCSQNLGALAIELIQSVLRQYGSLTAAQLSSLTHAEEPWSHAYKPEANVKISHESLREFYADKLDDALDIRLAETVERKQAGRISLNDLAAELGW